MLKVRRTMTEVLLEVTNCEIDSVVEETLRKVLSKGRTMPCPCSLQKTLSSQKWLLGVQSRESSKNKFLVALFSYLVQVYCVKQLHASTLLFNCKYCNLCSPIYNSLYAKSFSKASVSKDQRGNCLKQN